MQREFLGATPVSAKMRERETTGTEGSKIPQSWFCDVVCFHRSNLVLITDNNYFLTHSGKLLGL